MSITISYIIATKNRLPFLNITLSKLLTHANADEEIVVVDGDSSDGTKEYLQQLFDQGKIHQYISEPDRNQAHAWNKAMLMAKGTIIKKIIDDDVYDYNAIRTCANYMLQHPEVDVCISDSLDCILKNYNNIGLSSRLPWFLRWKNGEINTFTFGDIYLLIRKSSLSYIGLYDTQFKMIDWEYSLRISFLKAKIAYFKGCTSLSIATPGNVSSTATKKLLKQEGAIGKAKYGYPGDDAETSFYSRFKIAIGALLYNTKAKPASNTTIPSESDLQKIYAQLYTVLQKHNGINTGEIIS